MEPPTYEEATRHQPPNFHAPASPFYQVSFVSPPPYEGTITVQPDPFPVLRTPTVTTNNTSQVFIHQPVVVGRRQHVCVTEVSQVVATQPRSQRIISVNELVHTPGHVRCPRCQHSVTTVTKYRPRTVTYVLCISLIISCLFCGFCLIPFCCPSNWEVHHYCRHCGKRLHIYPGRGQRQLEEFDCCC
ncbi:lipopolysaccharide-induced tumor necrosis factor-alpha factor homolog [Phycodurus eques]|uniref:lipopolysaccharide-induced tumor necrosis factor-alpha factor homolog n=1 Tax=Phycodurus eques TaxID=693459 RepID=UPI002ACE64C0|nr:lipopolysaccharide-induced tumor necrosis factor-alpha factor homolog [Phycodurus eques]